MAIIVGNSVGGASPLKTLILEDPSGLEITGVVTESEQVLTAVASQDIREGKVAITSDGIVTGSKRIPAYETTQSNYCVLPGASFSIPLEDYDKYDYTKFQCMIAKYNTSPSDSVTVDRVVINNNVYAVNSSTVLSSVTKNKDTKSIDLNINNNTDDTYIIYYVTYKEV